MFEAVYDLEKYDRHDSNDPELFMGHNTTDLVTPYEEALELQEIYNSLGNLHKLVTLCYRTESQQGTAHGML